MKGSLGSLSAVFSLTLSVAILTLAVLCVNGFYYGLKQVIIQHHGHVTLRSFENKPKASIIKDLNSYKARFSQIQPFINFQGLILSKSQFKGMIFEGVDSTKWATHQGLIIGVSLAQEMDLQPGSFVQIVTTGGKMNVFSAKKTKIKVQSVVDFGKHDLNARYAFLPLGLAQDLLNQKNHISGVRLWLHDSAKMESLLFILSSVFDDMEVVSWLDMEREFFYVIESDKQIIFLVLFILIFIAGFNVSSSLFIQVFKKTREISILKAMGASHFFIFRMFIKKSLIIGGVGSCLGMLTGLIVFQFLLLLERKINFIPDSIYQINDLVFSWQSSDILWVFICTMFVSFVAGIFPARRAYKICVREGLAHE